MATSERATESLTPRADWQELCPSCMTANRAGMDFCEKCGRPLSSYAAVGPLESIRTEGFLYRGAVGGGKSRVVLVGMWLICLTMLIAMTLALLNGVKHGGGIGVVFPMALFFVLFGAMLWKATRNYGAARPSAPEHDGDNPAGPDR